MAGKPPASDPVQDAPKVSEPQRSAVGLPALTHALRISQQQMGVRRTALTLLRVNQPDGFDCPGCAWPEPDKPHTAEFCENGAKAVAEEATLRRVTPDFFAEHSVADLADRSGYWLGQQGRLTHPMYLAEGADRYEPVTWERAFDIVGEELTALDSPDEAVFYTSGRTSNEAAFLYQLFAREFGTNNLPDCSNMCHESSGSALTETIGIGKGSVLLEDLYKADLIIVAGQNPGTNHPRMLTALEKAKAGGTKIISINPLPEAGLERFKNPQTPRGLAGGGTALTDLFLQVRLGGDQALFRALNRLVLDTEGALDEDFIREHTHGFEEFARTARAGDDWDETLRATGLTRAEIDRTLAMVLASKRTIVCWAMGLTQHKHSVPTIQEVVNFLLLRGNIGRPGAGVCPVRGHSNVQGDRTMGIFERPAPAFLDALEKEFGFVPPREHGLDVVRAIRALRDGQAKVFFAMGGNFVSATPDTDVTEAAMRRARLTVHVSTKLNRSHVITGARALILPTLGRTERDVQTGPDGAPAEQFVTVEDSMGMVHASRGRLAPAGPQLLSETAIVARLARRVLGAGSRTPGRSSRGTTRRSATVSPMSSRASRTSTPGSPAPEASPSRTPPGQPQLPHRHREGQLHRRARRIPHRPRRAAAAPDAALPRPVQHHRLRPRRPLPRHQERPPGGARPPRRRPRTGPGRRRVHRPGQRMDGRQRAARARLPRRALPDGPRLRGRLLPRDQCPDPARPHRRHQQHPRRQVDRDPPGEPPGGVTAHGAAGGNNDPALSACSGA